MYLELLFPNLWKMEEGEQNLPTSLMRLSSITNEIVLLIYGDTPRKNIPK